MNKIQDEVKGWPEIMFAVAIVISEPCGYKSPRQDSPTWDYFAQQESILSHQHFLSLPSSIDEFTASTYRSNTVDHHSAVSDGSDSDSDSEDKLEPLVLSPITIAGHTWCDIREVEYRVWVKKDGVLDLDEDGTVGYLCSKPTGMGDVEQAINDGLSAVKSHIVDFVARNAQSRSAPRKLREAELRAAFDWAAIQSSLEMAAERITVFRYQTWFCSTFRRTERSHPDNESYRPSQNQSAMTPLSHL